MATWHQQKAIQRACAKGKGFTLQHETKWSVITNPPGEMMSISLTNTKEEAEELAKVLRHTYILKPRNLNDQTDTQGA